MAPTACKRKATELSLHPYNHAEDRDAVVGIRCKMNMDLAKQLPQIVSNARNHPFVVRLDVSIVAFINVGLIEPNAPDEVLVYLETLRVDEHSQGRGIGSFVIPAVMDAMRAKLPPNARVRFLATAMSGNQAIAKVLRRSGWTLRSTVHAWSGGGKAEQISASGSAPSLLAAMGTLQFVSDRLKRLQRDWQEVKNGFEIASLLQRHRDARGVDLCPGVVSVESHVARAKYLAPQHADSQARRVWKLERDSHLPVILFARPPHNDERLPTKTWETMVVAADIEGAEAAVVKADQVAGDTMFSTTFDSAITEEDGRSSKIFNSFPTYSFFVFDA